LLIYRGALTSRFVANSVVQMDVSRLKSKDARQLAEKVRRPCILLPFIVFGIGFNITPACGAQFVFIGVPEI
jgi:hypothetical protein